MLSDDDELGVAKSTMTHHWRILREAGVISADASDALDLERDSFVEGVVAGASRVLRNAAPHLNVPPTQK